MIRSTRPQLGKSWRGAVALLAGVALALPAAAPAVAASTSTAGNSLVVTTGPGWDVFNSGDDGTPYSYGPSIILNSDGSADMWNCTAGANGAWDSIRYRHSTDGGVTWGSASVVLAPTPGGADQYSNCDPGAVEFGGYYYVAYTGLNDSTGHHNGLFVARSTSPSGPFSKWDGSGWSGAPQPFLPYAPNNGYGIGEPSLVLVGTTLYVYYSYYDGVTDQTRVATADASSANWPATLSSSQVAIPRAAQGDFMATANVPMEDSTDVKYVDSLGLFVAIGVGDRWTFDSHIKAYTSTDGIHFTRGYVIDGGPQERINNIGVSGTASGHLDTTKSNFVIYAEPQTSGAIGATDFAKYVAREHLAPITLGSAASGAGADAFTGIGSAWTPRSGSWSVSGGAYHESDTTTPTYATYNGFVMDGGTYATTVRLTSAPSTDSFAGIGFDRHSGTSAFNDGYVALIKKDGTVMLVKSGVGSQPDTTLAQAASGLDPTAGPVSLRVVKSDTTIQVYAGSSPTPILDVTDTYLPYTGGGVALISHLAATDFGPASFVNNVHDTFADAASWTPLAGTWSTAGNVYSQTATGSSLKQTTMTGTVSGDTTYQFDTTITASTDPNGFVGLTFDQAAPTDSPTTSGYLAYLRANGNVGLYKAGTGVVAGTEVPSGTSPTTGPVHLKIVTYHIGINGSTGSIVQVYAGNSLLPQVNYFDSTSPDIRGGYTSLFMTSVTGGFANFSLDTQAR